MEPLKHMTTMTTLDLTSSFANGHWTLSRDPQTLLFFFKKDVSEQSHRPKPQHGRSTHQLIVVQAQLLFAIAEEHLNVEAVPRYVQARPRWLRPDHWMRSSVPGRAEHPTSGARSRSDSDRACAHPSS